MKEWEFMLKMARAEFVLNAETDSMFLQITTGIAEEICFGVNVQYAK